MEQSKPFEPGAPILIGCHAATSPPICSCSPLFDTVLVMFFLQWTLLAVFEQLSVSVDNAVGHSPYEQIQPV